MAASSRARIGELGRRVSAHPFTSTVLLPYLASRAALACVALASMQLFPMRSTFRAAAWPIVDAFVRWDSEYYLHVAELGYGGEADAFFPLYPALVRLVGLILPLPYAAFVVSNLAALAAIELLRRLVEREHGEAIAQRAAWIAIVFPTSFYLSAVYAESTYLACLLAAFVAARAERGGLAALFVGLTCLARPSGFLCATLPFLGAWLAGPRTLRTFPIHVLAAIPALAVLAVIHRASSGDPLAFLHGKTLAGMRVHWSGGAPASPPALLVLWSEGLGPNLVRRLLNWAALGLAAFAIVRTYRRGAFAEAAVCVTTFLVPFYFQRTLFDAASMARYALTAFPILVELARAPSRSPASTSLDATFPALGSFLMAAFACGYWVE